MIVIGIDPGFTRTGVVIMASEREPIAYATFAADDTVFHIRDRVLDLRCRIEDWIELSLENFFEELTGDDDNDVVWAIEKPIMGKNVENFEKQIRLFQELQRMVREDAILEVNPMQVKRAGAGDARATKLDIILASPFDGPGDWGNGSAAEATKNQEAVCDAWAVAVFAFNNPPQKVADIEKDPSRGPIIEKIFT